MAEEKIGKCTCGNQEFHAHQVCHHDVIVDGDGNWLRELCKNSVYESDNPLGPFRCIKCNKEYDEIPLPEK